MDNQNNANQNNANQNNANQNNANQGYENGNYQNGNYQNGNYQNGNYQNGNYQNGNGYRRLTKSRERIISGVCGGIAEYFNADVTIIRIVTVLFAFSGAGLIAYIVAAIIMPEK